MTDRRIRWQARGRRRRRVAERGVVTVGLVATPPDHPARVAGRLTRELPGLLADRVDRDVRWEVRSGWGAVTPRRDGGADALLDDVARRREGCGWDVAVCLTDLPLHAQRVPLVAHCSARRRVGVVSLPALGLGQLRAGRTAVAGLVEGLLTADERCRPTEAGRAGGADGGGVAPIRRVVDEETDDGEVGFVASRVTGRLRLVAGMVRANRPGRALLGLSKLLVGAFGTAAFSLATNSIWQMGDALDGLRLTVIMLLSLVALVGWLMFAHDLWEKPSEDTPAELARLFNLGTVLTLSLAAAVSYAVLFVGTLLAAALLIDASVLEQTLGRPVGVTRLPDTGLDHQLDGDGRRRHRLRPRGRGARACRRLRLPPDTQRLARRSGRGTGRRLIARPAGSTRPARRSRLSSSRSSRGGGCVGACGSAVDRGHVRLVVPGAGGRGQGVEPLELVGGEHDGVGGGVLLDAGDAAGAGDGGDVVALGQQPGQRDLGGGGADLGADRPRPRRRGRRLRAKVSPTKRGLVLRQSSSGMSSGVRSCAGEEAVPERGVGHEADAELAQQREELVLGVAGPQRVLGLQRGDRVHGVGAADRLRGGLGQPDVQDLALGDQLGQRADGLLDRGVRVDPVLVVEVDVVGAEPPQ